MTTYAIKRVKFNGGEGIDVTDFNAAQAYLQAQERDCLLAPLLQTDFQMAGSCGGSIASRAYCLGSSGFVVPSGSLGISNGKGMLYQWPDSTDWPPALDSPTLLAYPVDDGDLAHTFTPPTNVGKERWDILTYKLEEIDAASTTRDFEDETTRVHSEQTFYKQMATQATFAWVTGTEANIGSATEPSPATGYAKLCAVLTKYGDSGVLDADRVRDHRFPLGYHETHSFVGGMYLSAGWTNNVAAVKCNNATNEIYIPFPGPPTARLAYVAIAGTLSGGTVELVSVNGLPGGFEVTRYLSYSGLVPISDSIAGVTLLTSTPVWGGGLPYLPSGTIHQSTARLYITGATVADYISWVRWGYLGG